MDKRRPVMDFDAFVESLDMFETSSDSSQEEDALDENNNAVPPVFTVENTREIEEIGRTLESEDDESSDSEDENDESVGEGMIGTDGFGWDDDLEREFQDIMQSRDPALDPPTPRGQESSPTSQATGSTTFSRHHAMGSASTAQGLPPVWNWADSPLYTTTTDRFDDFGSGWTFQQDVNEQELDCFERVFTAEALTICRMETNRYADQNGDCLRKRWVNWTAVTDGEFMRFLAIRMLMGLNVKPEMKQYWSQDGIFQQPLVGKIMSQDRYFDVLKNLHFSDNANQPEGERLFKLKKIWEICNENFQNLLQPHQNLSVDETLVLYKGRLYFKQYIPNKRSRFGVKIFSIVDDLTKFILFSIIYSGKVTDLPFCTKEYGYGGSIVLKLIEPYLGKCHHLYIDNWFTSPNLAVKLLEKKTYVCGTLRQNRKNIPAFKEKMKRGDLKGFNCNNVLVQFWKDKKVVRVISTIHNNSMETTKKKSSSETVQKPTSILDYNKYARGIDQGDMMMHFYSTKRKTIKWYKKLFFHLIDVCIYNSFLIFKSTHPTSNLQDFQKNLIRQVLVKYPPEPKTRTRISTTNNPLRLSGRHFPSFNPPSLNKPHKARLCQVCTSTKTMSKRIRKETVYQCKDCNVALCAAPCFAIYHSQSQY